MPVKAVTDSAGAQLAMMRRRIKKECANPECDIVFEGLAITDYCSDECRHRAAYLRRKARAGEAVASKEAPVKKAVRVKKRGARKKAQRRH